MDWSQFHELQLALDAYFALPGYETALQDLLNDFYGMYMDIL